MEWRNVRDNEGGAMTILDTLITTHQNGEPYGVTDLNRVGEALIYVRDFLADNKYNVEFKYPVRTDWSEEETFPTEDDLNAILANLAVIRRTASVHPAMPKLPDTYTNLTADKANAIEEILRLTHEVAQAIITAWFYFGDLYCGEVNG
jgi:hypothetical protein